MAAEKSKPLDVPTVTRFMEDHVSKASELPDPPRYFGLHLGPARTPMIQAMATMPGPILLISFGKGSTSIKDRDDIDVVTCEKWDDFRQTLFFVENGEHQYQSLAIDDLSRLQQLDIGAILKRFSKDVMEAAYWGITAEHMTLVMAWLRTMTMPGLSLNVAVSCLEKEIVDGETIAQRVPDLQGAFQRSAASYFDIVVYHTTLELDSKSGAERGEVEHRVQTRPYGARNLATDEWGVLNPLETLQKGGIAEWLTRIEKAVAKAKPKEEAKAAKAKTKAKAAKAKAEPEPAPDPPAPEPSPSAPDSSVQEPESPSPESTDPAACKVLAQEIQGAFVALCEKAPHLKPKAIEALTGALENVGYEKVGTAVEKSDLGALQAIASQFADFEAEIMAVM